MSRPPPRPFRARDQSERKSTTRPFNLSFKRVRERPAGAASQGDTLGGSLAAGGGSKNEFSEVKQDLGRLWGDCGDADEESANFDIGGDDLGVGDGYSTGNGANQSDLSVSSGTNLDFTSPALSPPSSKRPKHSMLSNQSELRGSLLSLPSLLYLPWLRPLPGYCFCLVPLPLPSAAGS